MTYRRIEELSSPGNDALTSVQDADGRQRHEATTQDQSTEDEIGNYSRVHILNQATSPALFEVDDARNVSEQNRKTGLAGNTIHGLVERFKDTNDALNQHVPSQAEAPDPVELDEEADDLALPSRPRHWNCGHCGEGMMSIRFNIAYYNPSCGRPKDAYASEY